MGFGFEFYIWNTRFEELAKKKSWKKYKVDHYPISAETLPHLFKSYSKIAEKSKLRVDIFIYVLMII